jgi:hypothetical protein
MVKQFRLSLIFLFLLSHLYADETQSVDSSFRELHKKTLKGYVIPHVLRYDANKWLQVSSGSNYIELKRIGDSLTTTIYQDKEKLTNEQEDSEFQISIKNRYADPAFCSGVEFIPSEIVLINGISFLHQKAIINLVPNSRYFRKIGKEEHERRTGEKGAQDQLDFYVCYSEKGRISFCINSPHTLSQEDQKDIDELLRGFSFDGSACRGPKKLRALKSAFEFITNQ